jgi:serine/threonine-protein kinase PpkA
LITTLLKKSGHDVIDVNNGVEGLMIILAELPDIVISDVEMPKLSGIDVLQSIRQDPETAGTPVILLTHLDSRADMRKGMSKGADDYISKPFEPSELMDAVHAQLAKVSLRSGKIMPALSGFEETSPAELDSIEHLAPSSLPAPSSNGDWPFEDSAPRPTGELVGMAWALNLRILNQATVRPLLSDGEWKVLLEQLLSPLQSNELLNCADYSDLQEGSATLFFLDQTPSGRDGAQHSALAVQAMVEVGTACRQWAAEQFSALSRMPIRVAVSMHLGSIEVIRQSTEQPSVGDKVVGQTADFIGRLREGEPPLLWRVAASATAVQAAKGLYRLGAQMDVGVGNQVSKVHALLGLHADASNGKPARAVTPDWI